MTKIKEYKKTGVQRMRPYKSGEDLKGVSVSDEDKQLPTLVGGMIAVGDDDGARWYVSKSFFNANYAQILPEYQNRVILECRELDKRVHACRIFIKSKAQTVSEDQLTDLISQEHAMTTYLEILESRISKFQV